MVNNKQNFKKNKIKKKPKIIVLIILLLILFIIIAYTMAINHQDSIVISELYISIATIFLLLLLSSINFVMYKITKSNIKKIILILFIILLCCGCIYPYSRAILLLKDKSHYENHEYKTIVSLISKNDVSYFNPSLPTRNIKEPDYLSTIKVNGITINMYHLGILKEDFENYGINRTLTIEYLPNSKYAINIYVD